MKCFSLRRLLAISISFMMVLQFSQICFATNEFPSDISSSDDFPLELTNDFIRTANFTLLADGSLLLTKQSSIFASNQPLAAHNTTYAQDTILICPATTEDSARIISDVIAIRNSDVSLLSGGSQEKYDWDDSLSVIAHSRVYYETSTYNGNSMVKITQVSGGYEIHDPQIKVTAQNILCSMTGINYSNAPVRQEFTQSETSSNWTHFLSFAPVQNIGVSYGGATYTLTLQSVSGGSTWKLTLGNTLALPV